MKKYVKYELQMIKNTVKETEEKYYASDPESVFEFLVDICNMDKLPKEHFVELAISSKGEIIGYSVISVGDISSSIVHPREVFQFAILSNAAVIIVAHNHPSGDPTPSEEDIKVTKRLTECSKIMGIKLVDHVIVGDNNYYSFMKNRSLE